MTTFSQLVDSVIQEMKRPDLLVSAASYLNQAIRELHFDPQTGNAIHFKDNLTEVQLTASSESGYTWDIPNPTTFHGIALVRYNTRWTDGEPTYPPELTPSRGLQNRDVYYYRGGSRFAFAGYGGMNGGIQIAYYSYPRALKYFSALTRPASWDVESGWTYLDPQPVDDTEELARQERVTNWILMRWQILLEEALRAKLYKRLERTEAARTSYSLYTTLRRGMMTAEGAIAGFAD